MQVAGCKEALALHISDKALAPCQGGFLVQILRMFEHFLFQILRMFEHFLVQISEFFVSQGASASRPNPEDEDGSDDSSHGVLLHNMPGGKSFAIYLGW